MNIAESNEQIGLVFEPVLEQPPVGVLVLVPVLVPALVLELQLVDGPEPVPVFELAQLIVDDPGVTQQPFAVGGDLSSIEAC